MTQLNIGLGISNDVTKAARYSMVDFFGNPIDENDSKTRLLGHHLFDVTQRINEIARESIEQDGAQYDSYSFMAYGLRLHVIRDRNSKTRYFCNGVEQEHTEWEVVFAA